MTQVELVALARKVAARHKLNPDIVCGVCERESSWNPWEMRYEPDFRSHYVAPQHLPLTAEIQRSCSWGLMQIMGETARERGFVLSMPQLCDPETGLESGCDYLAHLFSIKGSPQAALLAYNGGGNPRYDFEVLSLAVKYGYSNAR